MSTLWERIQANEAALALSLAVLSAGFTAHLAVENSHFYGDDFALFVEFQNLSFTEFLLTPLNVHFVPLHRLVNALIYSIAPLDFSLAVGVMAAFHVLGIVYLYKTLQLLRDSSANAWLTLVYASNVYLGGTFFWWCPGIMRLPYIFLAIACIYNYLCYRKTHGWVRLVLVIICFTASLGFYSKALLIPAYLVGIEICLFDRSKTSGLLRNAMCIGAVGIAGILFIGFAQIYSLRTPAFTLDVSIWLSAQAVFLAVVHQGALGVIANFPASTVNTAISILWLIAIAASVVTAPRNALVWAVGFSLYALNAQTIAMSGRMHSLANILATVHRYYFEMMFVVAFFLAFVIHNLDAARKLRQSGRGRRILHRGGVALALGITALAHVNFVALLDTDKRYLGYREVKVYVDNVDRGLAELRSEHPEGFTIGEGWAPTFVLGLLTRQVGRYSQFLPVFGLDPARIVSVRRADYLLMESGRIKKNPDRSNPK